MTLIAIKTSVKNEKSKAVFIGAKFHKKWFSRFFSWELATDLPSWAFRSATITLVYPALQLPQVLYSGVRSHQRLNLAPQPGLSYNLRRIWPLIPPLVVFIMACHFEVYFYLDTSMVLLMIVETSQVVKILPRVISAKYSGLQHFSKSTAHFCSDKIFSGI